MCYSSQIIASYKRYLRHWGAEMSLRDFQRLFWERHASQWNLKVPKALDEAFLADDDPAVQAIQDEIRAWRGEQAGRLEQELFKQVRRRADAERVLAGKATKKAQEDLRIASAKIAQLRGWISDLTRTELLPRDHRIFPAWYAPVLIWEDGRRVVKPMRYQCRPAGKPASYDTRYPGTYNARRDNLEGFWKGQFGHTHGVMLIEAFFENVERDGRKVVLKFEPQGGQVMAVACLWSRWRAPGGDELLSFAAITDEPPPEIAAAGHDRCIIPLKESRIDEWLRPDPRRLWAQYEILDDRERPYYAHRLAA